MNQMINVKRFGSVCIVAFVLLATVSATNNTATTAVATTAVATTAVATTAVATTAATATIGATQSTGAGTTAAITTGAAIAATPSTTAATPTATPAAVTTTTAAAAPTTQTTSNQDVTSNTTRIDMEFKITTGLNFSDVQNLTASELQDLKTDIGENIYKILISNGEVKVIKVVVTGFRQGSVIVEYYLVIKATSDADAAKIANAVTKTINSGGSIGNYTIDPKYEPEAYIIKKVKVSDVPTATEEPTTTVSTLLLIILGVAMFILLVIIIILIVLVACLLKLKKKREKE